MRWSRAIQDEELATVMTLLTEMVQQQWRPAGHLGRSLVVRDETLNRIVSHDYTVAQEKQSGKGQATPKRPKKKKAKVNG